MFILAQLWTYFLIAGALGAVAALAVQRRCATHASAPVAPDEGVARTRELAAQLRERDEALQSTRATLDAVQRDSLAHAQRLLDADQEVQVLRRQIAASRAELAHVLGRRDVEVDGLRAELSAAQSMLKNLTNV